MSKLDRLYTQLRRYCKEIGNKREGAIITQLVLHEDGSGRIETKLYRPTEANPFFAVTEEIVRFGVPSEGARKLEELIDGQNKLSSGD